MKRGKSLLVDEQRRLQWYVVHRLEYLNNRQTALKQGLEQTDTQFDYELLREFLENRGRIQELQNFLKRLEP